jgi:hypothetical protein
MQNLELLLDTLQLSLAILSRRDSYCLASKDSGGFVDFLNRVHIPISAASKVVEVLIWIFLECGN